MLEKPINKGNWSFKPDKKQIILTLVTRVKRKFIKGKGIVPLTPIWKVKGLK